MSGDRGGKGRIASQFPGGPGGRTEVIEACAALRWPDRGQCPQRGTPCGAPHDREGYTIGPDAGSSHPFLALDFRGPVSAAYDTSSDVAGRKTRSKARKIVLENGKNTNGARIINAAPPYCNRSHGGAGQVSHTTATST